jgi:hypothetical protein
VPLLCTVMFSVFTLLHYVSFCKTVFLIMECFRGYAPANCIEECPSEVSEEGSPLGIVPHSVRGFLAQFHQVLPASHMFSRCIACSDKVW